MEMAWECREDNRVGVQPPPPVLHRPPHASPTNAICLVCLFLFVDDGGGALDEDHL